MWTLNSDYHSVLIYWFVVASMNQDVAWCYARPVSYLCRININMVQFVSCLAGVLDVDAKLCLSLGADLLVCGDQHESGRSLVLC